MSTMVIKRLPAVRPLSEILPKGTEGGKEFSRIVNLLLFHDARSNGKKVTIFSDSAGDFRGLDSFGDNDNDKNGIVGYQYKFFPSPFTDKHRAEITSSLRKAIVNQKNSKIQKWILVTPDDLLESGTRKNGGDVTWFENLRQELSDKIEVEHWGHTKLQLLFLSNPIICLYYYPELIENGANRKETILSIRVKYNSNLITLYRGIEFVGMSVRDEEASRSVPMENIYIPLAVVPEATAEDEENIRSNPIQLLKPNRNSVILGDPGSGKSTLLRFLALVGTSKELQRRYKTSADHRLPLIVTLRSYADELKSHHNLSLLEYILDSIKADFSLDNASKEFLEYYFETGQAILLFDGLDELPDPNFKRVIRDRIRTFINTYPGNAIIVTSRIVGYGNPFRFDENSFFHYRLAKLQLPEIEQFVKDWYYFRIENEQKRKINIESLINTIKDEDHEAIRSLAENPLLLTIITLVHRVDAVLPDERVVLYEKCTETLLETWQNSKYSDTEVKNRGRVTRRNQRRMEAIAYWMQQKSVGTHRNERAVVSYKDLKTFLARYISKKERLRDLAADPEDIAEEFLTFIKDRAGLLIEAGDKKYSFVHLTFQEYLTAAEITTTGEEKGVSGIWGLIKDKCNNSRWSEVIRLLVAGLKNDRSKDILVQKILTDEQLEPNLTRAQLLGGLLIDGVESAEDRKQDILHKMLISAINANSLNDLRGIMAIVRKWMAKDTNNGNDIFSALENIKNGTEDHLQRTSLALKYAALGLQNANTAMSLEIIDNEYRASIYNAIFNGSTSISIVSESEIKKSLDLLIEMQKFLILDSPYGNFIAASANLFTNHLDKQLSMQNIFHQQMFALCTGVDYGPFTHFNANFATFFINSDSPIYKWCIDILLGRTKNANDIVHRRAIALEKAIEKAFKLDSDASSAADPETRQLEIRDRHRELLVMKDTVTQKYELSGRNLAIDIIVRTERAEPVRNHINDLASIAVSPLTQELITIRESPAELWQVFANTSSLHDSLLQLLGDTFDLEPRIHWWDALRYGFLQKGSKDLDIFCDAQIHALEENFLTGRASEYDIFMAACQLIFDSWLYMSGYWSDQDNSIFAKVAILTRNVDNWALKIAHEVRNLAYGDSTNLKIFEELICQSNQNASIFGNPICRPASEARRRSARKNSS